MSLQEVMKPELEVVRGKVSISQLKIQENLSNLIKEDQEALWDCSLYTSKYMAGKLPLCVSMPIIICNNEVTELCITKGQEAIVVG